MSSYKAYREKALLDPNVKVEYDALQPEFDDGGVIPRNMVISDLPVSAGDKKILESRDRGGSEK